MAFNQLLIDQKPFRLKIFAVRTRLELVSICGPLTLPVAHIVAFPFISADKGNAFF